MTATVTSAVPVVGWRESDERWLAARRRGISASDVSAVLGFGPYATPWEVWADKRGIRPRRVDADKESIRLGVAMEPWLLAQAGHLLERPVVRTGHRLYSHPAAPWQMCSPDGEVDATLGVEAKTAGLASGFGSPDGWTEQRAPLGYEFQVRWTMRVRAYERMVLIALVAGMGLRMYEYTRDLSVEADMVAQVTEWYERHLVRGVEPPMGPRDNALMDDTYRTTDGGSVALDAHAVEVEELMREYADGLARENAGKAAKEAATARLKRLMGGHAVGTLDNRKVVSWNTRRGNVRWPDLVEDLIEVAGWKGPLLDVDELTERYRLPDSRSIDVKGIAG